ncbi:unnamed protein product [Dovyalis caffra]|uniref:Uncharacterized protein n=1 Tax=Dovyalis caffra TaxID=77055 RepID=A0AAV1SCQ0_9ROSI|nr:unnamed protein product [Dovyalis caffra]
MRPSSPTLCLLPFLFLTLLQRPTFASKKSYVVYLGGHSHGPKLSSFDANLVKDSHYEFLGSFLGSREFAQDAIFYSYTSHINGFAANLEGEVAAEIAKHPKVVSVFLNRGRKLHTTHSWSFLGLEKDGVVPSSSIWKKARFGEDTIIGNLDTESENWWRPGGDIQKGRWILWNLYMRQMISIKSNIPSSLWKLVGARYFNKGYANIVGHLNSSFDTPRDDDGHGSHTLSTAGGNFVAGANVFYLGNGTAKGGSPNARVAAYKGESLSPKALTKNKFFPLMSAADARATNASIENALLCKAGSLDPKKAKGKILVCLRGINARVDKGQQAALAGAVGMVLANDKDTGNEILADPHVLPASHINYVSGVAIFKYINSTKSPIAYITRPETKIGTKPAPFMAAFSSKGPNTVTPEILKPDITAPGVSVIAAYTEAQGPTNQDFDTRRVVFNSVSGTSMSCPHVSGIVGLLKTLHPTWSPAAIKSAIMTSGECSCKLREL